MLFLSIIFICYFYLLTLLGRFFYEYIFDLFKFEKSEKIFSLNLETFLPIISLFVLSNLAVIFNFFYKLEFFYLFLFPILLFLFIKYRKYIVSIFKNHFKNKYMKSIVIPTVISVALVDLNFNYDAALYNLKYQQFLLNHKILIQGIVFDNSFGLTQVGDYLSAIHTFNQNYIYSYFPNLVIYSVFFNILYEFLISKKRYFFSIAVSVLIYGIFDNFGIEGGRNGFIYFENLGKTDISFSIIFFIGGVFLYKLLTENSYQDSNLFISLLFIFFSVQYRIIGYLLVATVILYVLKNKNLFNLKVIKFFSVLLTIWVTRNLLLTSCLIYPVDFSCFNNNLIARDFSYEVRNYNRAYNLGDNLSLWFDEWIGLILNKTILINFIGAITTLLIIRYLFFDKLIKNYKGPYIFFMTYLAVWFFGSPDFRFASGLTLLFVSFIYLNYELKEKFSFLKNNIFIHAVFLFVLIFSIRVTSYKNYSIQIYDQKLLTVNSVSLVERVDGFYRPEKGDQCWANINCTTAIYDIAKKDIYGYLIFEKID